MQTSRTGVLVHINILVTKANHHDVSDEVGGAEGVNGDVFLGSKNHIISRHMISILVYKARSRFKKASL